LLHPDFNLINQNTTPNIIDRPIYDKSIDLDEELKILKKE